MDFYFSPFKPTFLKKEKSTALQQIKDYHNKKMQDYPQRRALLHGKKSSYVSSHFE